MEINPTISIIVPCYNIENKISKCLDSVLSQSYTNFEVICINDASTDNTLDILNKFQKSDDRIRVIDLKKNGGLANGRRIGIIEALGDYIAFVDGDDWIRRDYIQKLYEVQSISKCDVVICESHKQAFKHISFKRNLVDASLRGKLIKGAMLNDISINFFGHSLFPLSAWGKLYKKNLFNIEIMPTIDVFFQEDILLNLYIYKNINSIKFIDYPGYYYRVGGGSSSASRKYLDDMKSVYKIKKSFLINKEFEHVNAMNYILIELKNCLYIYFQRRLRYALNHDDVVNEADQELHDELYEDFNYLNGEYSSLKNNFDYSVIRDKDVNSFLNLAGQRGGIKNKIKTFVKKFL